MKYTELAVECLRSKAPRRTVSPITRRVIAQARRHHNPHATRTDLTAYQGFLGSSAASHLLIHALADEYATIADRTPYATFWVRTAKPIVSRLVGHQRDLYALDDADFQRQTLGGPRYHPEWDGPRYDYFATPRMYNAVSNLLLAYLWEEDATETAALGA